MDKNWHIHNTWDIALQHGHSAFRILKIVKDIESEYSGNKSKLSELEFGRSEYLKTIGQNHYLMSDHFKMCSASVMLFQSMMEALIHDSVETKESLKEVESDILAANKRVNFKNLWKYSLIKLGQDPAGFLEYNHEIYIKYRNNLVHPKAEGIEEVQSMAFSKLFNGFKKGWDAYDKLYAGLGHPHDDDSWNVMCKAHNLV